MRLEVEEGSVRISYIDILIDRDDIKVAEIGTVDKYPDFGGYCTGEFFDVWHENWRSHEDWKPTRIKILDVEGDDWLQVHDTSKYLIYMVLLKMNQERVSAYVRESEDVQDDKAV